MSHTMSDAQDWAARKAQVQQAAQAFGIDKIGFAVADPFFALKEQLIQRQQHGYASTFEEADIDKRTDPQVTFGHPTPPRSIVSIAIAYPSKLPYRLRSVAGARRGDIARSAWGEDYHRVLRRVLEQLASYMRTLFPTCHIVSMVDTGPLVDRAVAQRAGVGWIGHNCAVITPEFGSWVYLGELVTDIPFPPDAPLMNECGDCTLCIDACPTGALVAPGVLNAPACISYVTQTKTVVDDAMKRHMGSRLYGCDTCQVVCPKNKGHNWTHHPECTPDTALARPLLTPFLTMSNTAFQKKYGHTAAAWRGKTPLMRNAIIALGNARAHEAISEICTVLREDPRSVMRETAAWALGRMKHRQAYEALCQRQHEETDETVLCAIAKAMVRYEGQEQHDMA